jgi:CRP/FNR family transcriptional regulator, cyclic AMP receptor protein
MKPHSPFFPACLKVLKASALFSGLDEASLCTILGTFGRETWPKGAQLPVEQGSQIFRVVVSGRLELTRINPDSGRQVTLFTLGPGDAFDVVSLLDHEEHEIHPAALEPLEILTAPLDRAREWIDSYPAFNSALLPYLGEKIRELEDLSADLALVDTAHRLALLILHHATPCPLFDAEGRERRPLVNTLSNEAMARMIGSVRVVVNRHLQEFSAKGLISKKRGQLTVQNMEKLRRYCEEVLDP